MTVVPDLDGQSPWWGDVTPESIAQFLRVTGWERTDEVADVSQVWHRDHASLMLPLDPSYRDFERRLKDAIEVISTITRLHGEALALEIASARSDILLLRADQFTRDGAIPLSEAEQLLTSAHQMVLAAACSAIRPRASFRGRKPDMAKEFIAEDVRMGHTLRGSFVITILARHDDEAIEVPEDEVPAVPHAGAVREPSGNGDVPTTYTRQVMATLASGLSAVRSALDPTHPLSLDAAVERGASAELFGSVAEMTRFEGLRALDMSFKWSSAAPQLPNVEAHIVLPRDRLERAQLARDELRKRPDVGFDEVVGYVLRLERGQTAKEGVVVIDGNVGGTKRRVRVALAGKLYSRAVRAHEDRQMIYVRGQINLEGRSYWLRRPVQVDVFSDSGRPKS